MDELPLGLRHALEAGECVLFIGAGIGAHLTDKSGSHAPDGRALATLLADHFDIEIVGEPQLTKVSEIVEIRKGRPELIAFLREVLSDLQPDDNVKWLCSLSWRAIFTTNYDRGLQRAYDLTPDPPQNYKTMSATSDIVSYDNRFDVPIYHLHGSLFDSESPNIIITDEDYSKYKERRRMLFELLKKEFITSTILYIGYSNRDPNWNSVLTEISAEFYPTSLPQSYRVDPYSDEIDIEILKVKKKILTLKSDFESFVSIASAAISDIESSADKAQKMKAQVPSDLIPAFDKHPSSTTRLLSSWTYVNQAPFNDKSNLNLFLQGDRPNWALIASENYFKRDIEDQIYEDLLDFATSSSKTARSRVILSPAGYGTTTFLMTLAVKLVKDRAGSVFFLKPNQDLIEGDVEFAASISEMRPFFFVDNASEQINNLNSIIQRFKETNTAAIFIIGERLNEWRQSYSTVNCPEYQIEALSDPEIDRLLDYLGSNFALNSLEHLDRDLQFSAIKKNYNKELIVALKEATESRSFDAILEDEYRGISDEVARMSYLIVCCFYQYGTYIRDSLLAELQDISLVDLHPHLSKSAEGVIIFDLIDEGKGIFGARARHRKIANVVWERCAMSSEKSRILNKCLDLLNLNYSTDVKAFESFIRSDHLVDSIGTLDGKIQFFEKSCKKDPNSPYVRQHYSRMLMRENKFELALSEVQNALNIDNKIRVLFHTKGLILANMVSELESEELARKRLIQSEQAFRRGLNLNHRDHYCYQRLAQLYLIWAKRCTDRDESIDYISKTEEIISEGLKNVRIRDSLWIESANVQKYLGDDPAHLKALERAVSSSPGSIVPRYILGRTYRQARRYQGALDILRPNIINHPDEFRSFVEYALSSYYLGKEYKECISILGQSTLFGYGDPRFLAILGGMLFMDRSFSRADDVFNQATKRNFTAAELNRIQFKPVNPSNTSEFLRIDGVVISVKAGYSFIESSGYPKPFFCPGSKYKGLLMQKGLRVSFLPVFTAKGIIAINPENI